MFASLAEIGVSVRRANADAGLGRNTNTRRPQAASRTVAATDEARGADVVVDAAERQQHDEHDHEQREEIEETLDRNRSRGRRSAALRERRLASTARANLPEMRKDVVACESREHSGLQEFARFAVAKGAIRKLPALCLHGVVGEETDERRARSGSGCARPSAAASAVQSSRNVSPGRGRARPGRCRAAGTGSASGHRARHFVALARRERRA